MKCPKCNGSGWDDEHMIKCLNCDNGEITQNNEEWFATLSTRKKAEFLSGMCVAAVRDFEWSETKRCCVSYWERWLKEEHK